MHVSERGRTLLYRLSPAISSANCRSWTTSHATPRSLPPAPRRFWCWSGDFETLVEPSPQLVYKVMRAIMRVAHKVQRV